MTTVCFDEPEIVISRPWIEVSGRNLVCQLALGLLKCQAWPNQQVAQLWQRSAILRQWVNLRLNFRFKQVSAPISIDH